MNPNSSWRRRLRAFFLDEGGATSIEYAIMGAMAACIMIIGFELLGSTLSNKYSSVTNTITAAGT